MMLPTTKMKTSSRTSEALRRAQIRDPAQRVPEAPNLVCCARSLRWVPALVAAKGPLLGRDDGMIKQSGRPVQSLNDFGPLNSTLSPEGRGGGVSNLDGQS